MTASQSVYALYVEAQGNRVASTDAMQHRITRRTVLGGLLNIGAAHLAAAADYPSRTIRIISPYTPGGGTDVTARLLAGPLGRLLGQAIVVENKPGAGGSIGAAEVARAAPDGHTLLVDALAHVVNPSLMRGLAFDTPRHSYRSASSPACRR